MGRGDPNGFHPGLIHAFGRLFFDGEVLVLLVVVRPLFLDAVVVVNDHGDTVFLGFLEQVAEQGKKQRLLFL